MPLAYGTWPSPLEAEDVAAQGLRLSSVSTSGDDVYWIEGRPREGGRHVIVRRAPDGTVTDLTPSGFNARTRVHEYGGTAYAISRGELFFSNFADQRIYRTPLDTRSLSPAPLTPEGAWRYADFIVDERWQRLIAVREDHSAGGEPVNTIVAIPLPSSSSAGASAGEPIASGHDFYSSPRLSPDGTKLLWLAWRHPQMPWDGTELWVADVTGSGRFEHARRIAGGASESVYQPGWSPDGSVFFVSDRDGWWRLYRDDRADGSGRPALVDPPEAAEFGRPQWVFGSATWAFADSGRLVAAFTRQGHWHLAVVDAATGAWRQLDVDLEPSEWMAAAGQHAIVIGGSATTAPVVARVDLDTGDTEVLEPSSTLQLDPADVSVAEHIGFESGSGHTAHAFYYAPRNSRYEAPAGERPPLVAIGHGGPTAAASATLELKIQFWTTRGFAVVDVDYSGSTGYGRAYRERLRGEWGVADVDDMVHAVRHLAREGLVDPQRLTIRGGSAGGFTALAALTFHPGVFTAAASYYGVSDLEVLLQDTHKFESRYTDWLVGPYPAARDLYRARSPIHFADRLTCPLILFQGLEDEVVPPSQSEMLADALRAKGIPVAYFAFEGEQHGFRKAATIVTCLTEELAFYRRVLGLAAGS